VKKAITYLINVSAEKIVDHTATIPRRTANDDYLFSLFMDVNIPHAALFMRLLGAPVYNKALLLQLQEFLVIANNNITHLM